MVVAVGALVVVGVLAAVEAVVGSSLVAVVGVAVARNTGSSNLIGH